MSIYEQMVAAGVEIGHHESDLYVPVNETTRAIVAAYEWRKNVTIFTNQITRTPWYDIPFAFAPWWEARAKPFGRSAL